MVQPDLLRQLNGASLTTAEIFYHLPDHPSLLQSYIWQEYDVFPQFPKLKSFLDFWSGNLDGPLYQVRIAHCKLIKPRDVNFVDGDFHLH